MPVLNDADDVKVGTVGADAIYAGTDLVWSPGGGFSPLDLPGCRLWLDAADESTIDDTANPGRVAAWDDKAQFSFDVNQGTLNEQPSTGVETIGGLNALGFDGISRNDNMVNPAVQLTTVQDPGWSWFAVVRLDVNDSNGRTIYNSDATFPDVAGLVGIKQSRVGTASGGGGATMYTDDTDQDAFVVGAPFIARSERNTVTDTIEMFVDGVSNGSTATPNGDPTVGAFPFQVGMKRLTGFFRGPIGEIVCYAPTLSPEDTVQLENYLSSKWGI